MKFKLNLDKVDAVMLIINCVTVALLGYFFIGLPALAAVLLAILSSCFYVFIAHTFNKRKSKSDEASI